MLQCPPKIEIKVEDKVDRETVGYTGGRQGGSEIRVQSVRANVSMRKTSSQPYDADLKLTVFLVGRTVQLDRYVILDRLDSTFRFTEENKGDCSFSCGPVDLRYVTGSRKAGSKYEGYIVVIRDARNEIVVSQANRNEFERNASAMLEGRKGSVFDRDFNLIRPGNREPRPRPARRNP